MESILLTDLPTEIDDRISLVEATELLPKRRGKTPHLYTVRRWVAKGVKSSGGKVVRLRGFRVGQQWYTRLCWVREFISALTNGADGANGMDGCEVQQAQPTIQRRPNARLTEARRQLIAEGVIRETKKNKLGRPR